MLSLTCKASIKAVVYLALKSDEGIKTGIREIASQINENEHTVGKLLQKLVKEDIIKSAKGPNGGFYLTTEQKEQTMNHIILAIDGPDVFNHCGLGLHSCSELKPCPIHYDFKPIRDQFRQMCEEKKISDLYQDIHNGFAFLYSSHDL